MASYFYCKYQMLRKNVGSNTKINLKKTNKFKYLIHPLRLERINEEPEKEEMIVKNLSQNSDACLSNSESHNQNTKINSSKKQVNRLLNHTYGLPWPSSLLFFINQKRI